MLHEVPHRGKTEEAEGFRRCRPEEARRRWGSGGGAAGDQRAPVGGLNSAGVGPRWHGHHSSGPTVGEDATGSGGLGRRWPVAAWSIKVPACTERNPQLAPRWLDMAWPRAPTAAAPAAPVMALRRP